MVLNGSRVHGSNVTRVAVGLLIGFLSFISTSAFACDIKAEMLRLYEAVDRYSYWPTATIGTSVPGYIVELEAARAGIEVRVLQTRIAALCQDVLQRKGPDSEFYEDLQKKELGTAWYFQTQRSLRLGVRPGKESQQAGDEGHKAALRLFENAPKYFRK